MILSVTHNLAAPPDADTAWLREQLARIAVGLGVRDGRLTVVLQDDARMTELHEKYKGEGGTTDVLTFDLCDTPGGLEGEVHVCVDEARRCAGELGHPVGHELLLYAVHGLLHLLGYDDTDDASFRVMHEKEDELLRAIGLGEVFAARKGGLA